MLMIIYYTEYSLSCITFFIIMELLLDFSEKKELKLNTQYVYDFLLLKLKLSYPLIEFKFKF